MPRVSVIIPAHDAAPALAETLASVSAQSFDDWEIVAVDDGSRDETWSILENAGPRVRALRNPTALGPAAARNRALAQARGELVAFLDADDLLLPRYLERQIARLDEAVAQGRRVGLVACDARLLDDGRYADYTYLDMTPGRDLPITLERVLRRNPIYISALVPAAVGREVGWFDEELFGTEDFGLWIKILERGYEAIGNPEPLAVYRRATGSVSSDIARQGANNRRAYELALRRGVLTARQRRIAVNAIRYNRAMEAVAELRFGRRSARSVLRLTARLPLLLYVAATNPQWWKQWMTVLRTGRSAAIGR
jgi:teichuronic acid biosynthesis glycosyltransferase TuaG